MTTDHSFPPAEAILYSNTYAVFNLGVNIYIYLMDLQSYESTLLNTVIPSSVPLTLAVTRSRHGSFALMLKVFATVGFAPGSILT